MVTMQRPKVIFLDAVGTLFGVRGSVGEIYGKLAQEFGVNVDFVALNQAFFQSFAASPSPVFPQAESHEIPDLEFDWWKTIAQNTFQRAGVLHQFADFHGFFNRLYGYFASAEPWYVYPDVAEMLPKWQDQGIEMGIISNFDSRIYSVLQSLKLMEYFDSITICSEVGAAKPDQDIFIAALAKHDYSPEETLHLGDSYEDDYQGALALGMQAALLKRKDPVFPE